MKETEASLNEQLKEKGYKITTQRQLVLDVIKENQGCHMSPEDVFNKLKENGANIGIATVYRTLALLEEMGLIYKIELKPGCVSYELNQPEMTHKHHHLICLVCGKIIEVKEDLLDNLEEVIASSHGFLIKDHSLKFYGYCAECRHNTENK
jgi:Fur family ferric uptake transcriptional regulator